FSRDWSSDVCSSDLRIAAALSNIGYQLPGKKITINMAPADMRKEGSAYDLPIAVGVLSASGQLRKEDFDDCLIMGELSLDGSVRSEERRVGIECRSR